MLEALRMLARVMTALRNCLLIASAVGWLSVPYIWVYRHSIYLVRRLMQTVVVLVLVSVISFGVIHLAPGSPVSEHVFNPKVSPQSIDRMIKSFHLDEPLHKQYWLWLRDLFAGKLRSFQDNRPVLERILERFPATLLLSAVSLVIIFSISIPLGVYSATHRYSLADHSTTVLAFMGISLPGFALAYVLIILFVRGLGVPVLGVATFGVPELSTVQLVADRIWHLLLPSAIGAIGAVAVNSSYMRGSMIDAMSQDYIRTAWAKGLSETQVHYKHALRNALLPLITIFGFILPGLIGGSVIMESIFAWPGIGRLAYQAVLQRDYPTIMTLTTFTAVLVLAGNLIADLLYAVVDPRIRLG